MMDSRYRYVVDSNVIFDADKGGILHEMFQLPFTFITSDFIAYRELLDPPFAELHKLGLHKLELTGTQIPQIFQIRSTHKELSIQDISVFLLARDQGLVLLSGEKSLRNFAESAGITVHGTLWLVDKLIEERIITRNNATLAMRQMQANGRFLPKEECDQRFEKWRE
jgi:predicted nucleic acid-binding protein